MASDYTDEYIDNIFYLWYENDKKAGSTLLSIIPKNDDGRKPAALTISGWIAERGWIERADVLDAELARKKDDIIINKRAEMFEKHVKIGAELIEKGLDFLKSSGVKTDASAIRAIDLGLETERISVGLADSYAKIAKMSDEDIQKELRKLLGKPPVNEDDILDGEITDTESK
jgi:hypothetical protein